MRVLRQGPGARQPLGGRPDAVSASPAKVSRLRTRRVLELRRREGTPAPRYRSPEISLHAIDRWRERVADVPPEAAEADMRRFLAGSERVPAWSDALREFRVCPDWPSVVLIVSAARTGRPAAVTTVVLVDRPEADDD